MLKIKKLFGRFNNQESWNQNGNSFPPTRFGGILFQSTTWQVNRPSTCTFSHMTFLMSYVTFSNTHVDGLFACHVVSWRGIPPNRVGGKLCPIKTTANWQEDHEDHAPAFHVIDYLSFSRRNNGNWQEQYLK